MKTLKIGKCEDCPKTTHKYHQSGDYLVAYCGELKGKASKIPDEAKIHPDCPLGDYKKCECEPFQSCSKYKEKELK